MRGRFGSGWLVLTLLAGAFATATTGAWAQSPRTLIVAAPQTPTGFDGDLPKVATRQMVTQVYEGLVRYKRVTGTDGRVTLDATQVEGHLCRELDSLARRA